MVEMKLETGIEGFDQLVAGTSYPLEWLPLKSQAKA